MPLFVAGEGFLPPHAPPVPKAVVKAAKKPVKPAIPTSKGK